MAKKKAKKKKGRTAKLGKVREVPKSVRLASARAVNQIRIAKRDLEAKAPRARKAWAELHGCESRLSRLV